MPESTPGEEIMADPVWAGKMSRALVQSDRGEGMPWREFETDEVPTGWWPRLRAWLGVNPDPADW